MRLSATKYGSGGTDCSLPLAQANRKNAQRRFAGVILVSDNENRVYAGRASAYGQPCAMGVLAEWQNFVANQQRLGNDGPKLVCIDLQAYTTTQAPEREDILNVVSPDCLSLSCFWPERLACRRHPGRRNRPCPSTGGDRRSKPRMAQYGHDDSITTAGTIGLEGFTRGLGLLAAGGNHERSPD